MNKYDLITLNALLVLVLAVPLYAMLEPGRMQQAQAGLRRQLVADGDALNLENSAFCHGPTGEGTGAMPALNHPGLAQADSQIIYRTIAHSPHGSAMAAWHVEEGGILNNYQVEGLVALIKHGNWQQVGQLAASVGFIPPTLANPAQDFAAMDATAAADPHECRACHQEPEMHADRFGQNCARCHTLISWRPALLTRHNFLLDHGGQGELTCDTCHPTTYAENTCFQCHDHQPEAIQTSHAQAGMFDVAACATCHPTGAAGEAERYAASRAGLAP